MAESTAPARDDEPAGDPGQTPDKPTELGRGGWLAAVRRVPKEYSDDDLSDWAASLTYRGIQSIFPGLLVLVSLLGLLGKSATQPLITQLGAAAPANVRQILLPALQHLQQDHAAAGILAVVAVIWAACGRRPATSARSCAPPTPSTTCPRGARSGRHARSGSAVTVGGRGAAGRRPR